MPVISHCFFGNKTTNHKSGGETGSRYNGGRDVIYLDLVGVEGVLRRKDGPKKREGHREHISAGEKGMHYGISKGVGLFFDRMAS